MKMTISAEITFVATHAVQLDPHYAHPHTLEWTLSASVAGTITGPGWIMRFEDLLVILNDVIPASRDLNDVAAGGTSETIAAALWEKIEIQLPATVDLVRLELTEAPKRRVVIERDERMVGLEERVATLEYREEDDR